MKVKSSSSTSGENICIRAVCDKRIDVSSEDDAVVTKRVVSMNKWKNFYNNSRVWLIHVVVNLSKPEMTLLCTIHVFSE
jgi:hypothetical protein